MTINPLICANPQQITSGEKKPGDAALPVDSFQSVASNSPGRVNINSAVNAIFGEKNPLKTKWGLKTEDIKFSDNGTYCGPAPLKNGTSIFMGDGHNYRRISQETGGTEWQFKFPENDSFVQYDPVVTKDGLICLRYNHGFIRECDGWKDYHESLVVLDAESGRERFRYAEKTGIYDRVNTDDRGNFYFATVTDQKLYRVSPDGTMTLLNKPEKGKEEFLCDFKVTGDGTVFYPHLNSTTMVRLENGRETTFKVEGSRIDEFHPLENGQVVVISNNNPGDPCREVVSCYGGTGKKIWEKRIKEEFSNITVANDGRIYHMRHGDSYRGANKPTTVECIAPDGTSQWQFSFDDPAISNSFDWLDCKLRTCPDGDLLILSKRGGNILRIKSDGTEGWKITHRGNEPKYSITHDEKLYIIERGGFERIDLKTGSTEIDYNTRDKTLTRYAKDAEPEIFKLKNEDLIKLKGIILQKDENHLFSFDEKGNFCAIELPGSSDDAADSAPGDRIEVIDDFVNIGGVLLPVNKGGKK